MKRLEGTPFKVGEKVLYCPPGTTMQTVAFISLGPCVGRGVKGPKDFFWDAPQTAIVRDQHDNLLTVSLADLKPLLLP